MSNNYFDPTNPFNYWAQEANSRASTAEAHENAARSDLEVQKFANQSNVDLIIQLRSKASSEFQRANMLQQNNAKLESEKEFFENLLSLPMKEIAERNGQFKQTYEAEQLVLSKWILSQKAYAETAMQIGLEAGKSTEEVQELYKDNIISVLANATKHGNDAVTNPVLKENINKIVKTNKK